MCSLGDGCTAKACCQLKTMLIGLGGVSGAREQEITLKHVLEVTLNHVMCDWKWE